MPSEQRICSFCKTAFFKHHTECTWCGKSINEGIKMVTPKVGEVIKKDWGWTKCIYEIPHQYYIMEAFIKAGGRSSFGKYHRHEHYHNLITVLSGELLIDRDDGGMIRQKINGFLGIWAGIKHKFTAITDVKIIEIYEADYISLLAGGSFIAPSIYEDTIRDE